jgi:hypothetical protein
MFCTNCGIKVKEGTNFCSECGTKQKFTDNNGSFNNENCSSEEKLEIPESLLMCEELRIGGSTIEFTDETGKNVVTVINTNTGLLKSPSFEYLACERNGNPYTFMTSRVKDGDDKLSQTAFDIKGQMIGSAKCNSGLASMAKTEILIWGEEGKHIVLEEKVGFVKGLLKIIAPADYSIGVLASARTGNMDITYNGMRIGMIESTRGSVHNTYRILDCESLRQKVDIRLIILGMTVKAYYIK